jgi:SRSO17 transposase
MPRPRCPPSRRRRASSTTLRDEHPTDVAGPVASLQQCTTEGTKGALTSRFAALRVRPSHRDTLRAEPHAQEWLLIEWPDGEKEPTKYWLSTLPADTPITELVDTAKLRWRIERDFQDLKQEIGLDHYEGRGWRGFHHHAALSIAAYGFLVAERSPIPPSAPIIRALARQIPRHENDWHPRGASAA